MEPRYVADKIRHNPRGVHLIRQPIYRLCQRIARLEAEFLSSINMSGPFFLPFCGPCPGPRGILSADGCWQHQLFQLFLLQLRLLVVVALDKMAGERYEETVPVVCWGQDRLSPAVH